MLLWKPDMGTMGNSQPVTVTVKVCFNIWQPNPHFLVFGDGVASLFKKTCKIVTWLFNCSGIKLKVHLVPWSYSEIFLLANPYFIWCNVVLSKMKGSISIQIRKKILIYVKWALQTRWWQGSRSISSRCFRTTTF